MPYENGQIIRIHVETVDHAKHDKVYTTLAGAQKYAHDRVGPHPSIGLGYAVADDGIVVLYVEGCSMGELFPGAE